MRLFRPVGLRELESIAASGYRMYPPRFAWQPIFYPVLTREYARSIIKAWNSRESEAGHCGFITEFDFEDAFAARYPVRQLGGGTAFRELWVPSEELDELHSHIVGQIRVIESIYGPAFSAEVDADSGLPMSVVTAGNGT